MITASEYQKRRALVQAKLATDEVLLLFANQPTNLEGDRYQANNDLLYLTGNRCPHSALLLGQKTQNFYANLPMTTKQREQQQIWLGTQYPNNEKLRSGGGFSQVHFYVENQILHDLEEFLQMYECTLLYYDFGQDTMRDYSVLSICKKFSAKMSRSSGGIQTFKRPGILIHEFRLYKSPAEIQCIKKSIEVSISAHQILREHIWNGDFTNEAQAHALLQAEFIKNHSQSAYPPIIAADTQATTLHYTDNNRPLHAHSLLLIDAGAKANDYVADITRTWAQKNNMHKAATEVYETLKEALRLAIQECISGNTFADVEVAAINPMLTLLKKIKILRDDIEVEKEMIKTCYPNHKTPKSTLSLHDFFPHRIGHWIGLDVHDVGSYYATNSKTPRKFSPGMVITVEPGLYFRPQTIAQANIKSELVGIGIRLEEMILITDGQPVVLTSALPL